MKRNFWKCCCSLALMLMLATGLCMPTLASEGGTEGGQTQIASGAGTDSIFVACKGRTAVAYVWEEDGYAAAEGYRCTPEGNIRVVPFSDDAMFLADEEFTAFPRAFAPDTNGKVVFTLEKASGLEGAIASDTENSFEGGLLGYQPAVRTILRGLFSTSGTQRNDTGAIALTGIVSHNVECGADVGTLILKDAVILGDLSFSADTQIVYEGKNAAMSLNGKTNKSGIQNLKPLEDATLTLFNLDTLIVDLNTDPNTRYIMNVPMRAVASINGLSICDGLETTRGMLQISGAGLARVMAYGDYLDKQGIDRTSVAIVGEKWDKLVDLSGDNNQDQPNPPALDVGAEVDSPTSLRGQTFTLELVNGATKVISIDLVYTKELELGPTSSPS